METIALEYPRPSIAVLRLNRPQSRNALSWQLMAEYKQLLKEIDANNHCRVVVLTGSGKSFCAGMDLVDQSNTESIRKVVGPGKFGPRAGMRGQEFMAEMMPLMRRIQQPIVAAINGHAYGGGLALALASDVRIAAQSARFCTQFIRLGLSGCDAGVSYLLPKLIGAGRAHDMMITARVVDAELAERWGLVTEVVPDAELERRAIALAEQMCEFSPYGLISTKQGMWTNIDATSLEAAMHIENRNQILNSFSGDVEEAAAAFIEKRTPVFDIES